MEGVHGGCACAGWQPALRLFGARPCSFLKRLDPQAAEEDGRTGMLALQSDMADPDAVPLLLDPQTSGGLLFGVAADQADGLCQALIQSGYVQVAAIGTVEPVAGATGARIAID